MNSVKDTTDRMLELLTGGEIRAEYSEKISSDGCCVTLTNSVTGLKSKTTPHKIRQCVYMAIKNGTFQVGWGLGKMHDFSSKQQKIKDEFFSGCSFVQHTVEKRKTTKVQAKDGNEVTAGLPSIPSLRISGPFPILGKQQGSGECEFYCARSDEENTPLVELAMTKTAYMNYYDNRKESLSKSTKYDKNGFLKYHRQLNCPNNPYQNCARIKGDAERMFVHAVCVRLDKYFNDKVKKVISQYPLAGKKGLMYVDLCIELTNGKKMFLEVNGECFHSDDRGTDSLKKSISKANGIPYLCYVPVRNVKRDGEEDIQLWLEAKLWPALLKAVC